MEFVAKSARNFASIEHRINILQSDPNIHNIEISNLEAVNFKLKQENNDLKQQVLQLTSQFQQFQTKISVYEDLQSEIEGELQLNVNKNADFNEDLIKSANFMDKIEVAYKALQIQDQQLQSVQQVNSQQYFILKQYESFIAQLLATCQTMGAQQSHLVNQLKEQDEFIKQCISVQQKNITENQILVSKLDFPFIQVNGIDNFQIQQIQQFTSIIQRINKKLNTITQEKSSSKLCKIILQLIQKNQAQSISEFQNIMQTKVNVLLTKLQHTDFQLNNFVCSYTKTKDLNINQLTHTNAQSTQQLISLQQQLIFSQQETDQIKLEFTQFKEQQNFDVAELKDEIYLLKHKLKDFQQLHRLNDTKQKIKNQISQISQDYL
ncbi:hypothetical protein SS50377_20128 [Spironucleus salmonicida]|uniref:Uncharacterized protein n=1 Tax=Spironucleus salmonicida TaxID=348837 RepID=V6LKN8_9EUKA|nr:hypothetical protein SS50377_20128 [Spironucleus salmonicida]|eukprot:EST45185.1 Hypothetical protein SS50377_14757 [Spironucleus salmonicida]